MLIQIYILRTAAAAAAAAAAAPAAAAAATTTTSLVCQFVNEQCRCPGWWSCLKIMLPNVNSCGDQLGQ